MIINNKLDIINNEYIIISIDSQSTSEVGREGCLRGVPRRVRQNSSQYLMWGR